MMHVLVGIAWFFCGLLCGALLGTAYLYRSIASGRRTVRRWPGVTPPDPTEGMLR